jgi:hypothetical protein
MPAKKTTRTVSAKQVSQIVQKAAKRESKAVHISQGQRKALRATKR